MRNRRLVALLFAAAITTAAGLAVPSPAQAADAIVKLMSVQNGKCLQPASLDAGEVIVQQSCDGSHAQQWRVHWISSTKFHLVNNMASDLCIEVSDGPFNGGRIGLWFCGPNTNDNWSFGVSNKLVSRISGTSSHCIATLGNSDGLAVELWRCDSSDSQRWLRPLQ